MTLRRPSSSGGVANYASALGCGKTPSAASLLVFFALAFAWSWTCWLLAPALKVHSPVAAITLSLAGGFGPSLAAVAVVAYGDGLSGLRRWLMKCIQWRAGWYRALLAFVFPVVFMGLAATAHVALGGSLPPSQAAGHVGMAAANFLLIFFVGGPLGEEFGWRGYALPALSLRWGWRFGSLLLGAVWAVFHVVALAQAGRATGWIAWWSLGTVASRVVIVWLYNNAGRSVLTAALFHAMQNLTWQLFPVQGSYYDPRITGLIMLGIAVAVAWLWGRARWPGADITERGRGCEAVRTRGAAGLWAGVCRRNDSATYCAAPGLSATDHRPGH